MEIKNATFVVSNSDYRKCPDTRLPEYAFIGRSNVGKSSLINMLTNNKSLAKTSVKPGKTQLINHFLINKTWYLVDLPGYGYARTSKASRMEWQAMINDYILNRETLANLFVLIDSRIPPQKIDIEFINYMAAQMYLGGTDYPQNNVTIWRPLDNSMKWRWILYDMDFSFSASSGYGFNMFKYMLGSTSNGTLSKDDRYEWRARYGDYNASERSNKVTDAIRIYTKMILVF